jgi:N-acyl homoserine lactone hydrolase
MRSISKVIGTTAQSPSTISARSRRWLLCKKRSETLTKEKAQLWINHDKAQRDSLKMSPEFYD